MTAYTPHDLHYTGYFRENCVEHSLISSKFIKIYRTESFTTIIWFSILDIFEK